MHYFGKKSIESIYSKVAILISLVILIDFPVGLVSWGGAYGGYCFRSAVLCLVVALLVHLRDSAEINRADV